jgi:hypothetical protein
MGLFSRRPKLRTCFFCSELFEFDTTQDIEHYKTHLIEVTDVNGDRAFTFECPKCGPMDSAWGAKSHDPEDHAAIAMKAHLMMTHKAAAASLR